VARLIDEAIDSFSNEQKHFLAKTQRWTQRTAEKGEKNKNQRHVLAILVSRHLGALSGATNGREEKLVPLAEAQNCLMDSFHPKDTKRPKALLIGRLQQSWAQFSITRFDSSSNSIFRGEFPSASVPCEPELEAITHSCLQQAGETTKN
jgi:hypothetical protein